MALIFSRRTHVDRDWSISSILAADQTRNPNEIKIEGSTMQMTSKRVVQLALALGISGFAANYVAPAASQDTGWITLFDGKNLDEWNQVGESNWHVEDGAVIADKMAGKEAGYLVSKKSYKNFIVRVEFWPSDDANSGIYFRCLDPKKITDRTCYEANIFDQRPEPSYGTGAITRYVEINPMPKAGGKWNTYEVTANGRDITVVLNGQTTATLRNGMFDEGPIALQHGAGTIKFRKVEVKPL
jgi:3-keto-disaccharide hydrolase